MPEIKFTLSENLKQQLTDYATENNLSVAACIRQCIESKINGDAIHADENNLSKESRDRRVYAYFSPAEYAEIVSRAAGHPLSQYIRHTVLSSSTPIEITLYTEDVQQLTLQLSTFTSRLVKYLNGAKYRGEISEVDVDYLKGLLQNILDLMREYVHQTRKNQTAIRNAGMRHLRKQINDAIKKDKGGKQK